MDSNNFVTPENLPEPEPESTPPIYTQPISESTPESIIQPTYNSDPESTPESPTQSIAITEPVPEQITQSAPESATQSFAQSSAQPAITSASATTPNIATTQNIATTPNITTSPYQSGFQSQPSLEANDDDLLRAYIGKNYDKITTQKFNIPAFFLNFIYFLYRKMAGWGILVGLLASTAGSILSNLIAPFFSSTITYSIISYILSLLITGLASAFMANKLYLERARKKINEIKEKHPDADRETLLTLCAKKGGTSLALAIIVPLALIIIIVGIFFLLITLTIGQLSSIQEILRDPNIWSSIINSNSTSININSTSPTTPTNPNPPSTGETLLYEDVQFNGYSCLSNLCNFIVMNNGEIDTYRYDITEHPIFKIFYDYSDSLTINIYYIQTDTEKVITDYDVYIKSTGESLKSVETEEEFMEKMGLYDLGTHTDTLTYIEYDWPDFIFTNQKGTKLKMSYNEEESNNLITGTQYIVTFNVEEGILDYDYNITSITLAN